MVVCRLSRGCNKPLQSSLQAAELLPRLVRSVLESAVYAGGGGQTCGGGSEQCSGDPTSIPMPQKKQKQISWKLSQQQSSARRNPKPPATHQPSRGPGASRPARPAPPGRSARRSGAKNAILSLCMDQGLIGVGAANFLQNELHMSLVASMLGRHQSCAQAAWALDLHIATGAFVEFEPWAMGISPGRS